MSELAEGARLEIVCTAKSGTEGSNPSLSATIIMMPAGNPAGRQPVYRHHGTLPFHPAGLIKLSDHLDGIEATSNCDCVVTESSAKARQK